VCGIFTKDNDMDLFTRDDGRALPVLPGFRKQLLSAPRISVRPKAEWGVDDYRAAADRKVQHAKQFTETVMRFGGTLQNASVLELGCGGGIDSVLTAMEPVRSVVGIDLELTLFDPGEAGTRIRRLMREVLAQLGVHEDIDAVLKKRPVRFATMDATQMSFPDHSFDLLRSRAVMEHVIPVDKALAEMARVVRPGGLIYHSIDPFYWLKGCHKTGVVDMPWAHARLTPAEYHRFVAETEGEREAAKRSEYLLTLNQFTVRQWRRILESGPFEILQWRVESWPLAETLLEQHPDVRQTLLEGIEPTEITCGAIRVWMRNKGVSKH
jgi:ubiquinone/menaquinone biosynthesis C-methylase UbiE